MKILAVSLDYPPTPGGISAHVYELYAALHQLGHDITVLTKKATPAQKPDEMRDGIRVVALPKRRFGPLYGRTINKHINRLLAQDDYDLVHIHGMRPLEFLTPEENTDCLYQSYIWVSQAPGQRRLSHCSAKIPFQNTRFISGTE